MLRKDANDPRETCPFCHRWISLEHRRCLCGAWIKPPFGQTYLSFSFALILLATSFHLDPFMPRLFSHSPPPLLSAGLFGLIVSSARLSLLHDHCAQRRKFHVWPHLFFTFTTLAALLAFSAVLVFGTFF